MTRFTHGNSQSPPALSTYEMESRIQETNEKHEFEQSLLVPVQPWGLEGDIVEGVCDQMVVILYSVDNNHHVAGKYMCRQ
jgi:hypothetical protein